MPKKTSGSKQSTVTLTHAAFEMKLKKFLDENGACEGDWFEKAKAAFLGYGLYDVTVDVKVPAKLTVQVSACSMEEAEKAAVALIKRQQHDGEFDGFEHDDFEFELVATVATEA